MLQLFLDFLMKLGQAKLDPEVRESIDSHYSITNGKLDGVRYEDTSKHGGNITGPRFIVIHYTAGNNPETTVRIFKTKQVSAHLIVDRDGDVIQMVNFMKKAWHAGKSVWTSKWGTKHTGLNSYAIGIELSNYGYYRDKLGNVGQSSWPVHRHKNGGPERKWQPYTDEQFETTAELVLSLMKEYNIPAEHVVGHDDISPDRKVDPGPEFDMEKLRDLVGGRS